MAESLICRIFGHKWHTYDRYEDGFECQRCWRFFCKRWRGIWPNGNPYRRQPE